MEVQELLHMHGVQHLQAIKFQSKGLQVVLSEDLSVVLKNYLELPLSVD